MQPRSLPTPSTTSASPNRRPALGVLSLVCQCVGVGGAQYQALCLALDEQCIQVDDTIRRPLVAAWADPPLQGRGAWARLGVNTRPTNNSCGASQLQVVAEIALLQIASPRPPIRHPQAAGLSCESRHELWPPGSHPVVILVAITPRMGLFSEVLLDFDSQFLQMTRASRIRRGGAGLPQQANTLSIKKRGK